MVPYTTATNAKNCILMVTMEEGMDWDDFVCMVQQVQAIDMGYADPIKVEIVEDPQGYVYTWTEAKDGNSDGNCSSRTAGSKQFGTISTSND